MTNCQALPELFVLLLFLFLPLVAFPLAAGLVPASFAKAILPVFFFLQSMPGFSFLSAIRLPDPDLLLAEVLL